MVNNCVIIPDKYAEHTCNSSEAGWNYMLTQLYQMLCAAICPKSSQNPKKFQIFLFRTGIRCKN